MVYIEKISQQTILMFPKDKKKKKSLALRALQNHMTECLQDMAALDLRVLSQGQESFYGKNIAECYNKKHSKKNTVLTNMENISRILKGKNSRKTWPLLSVFPEVKHF